MDSTLKFGLIGFGEVGGILCAALKEKGAAWVGAWDILLPDPAQGSAMRTRARAKGIEPCESPSTMFAQANVVICAVTAANALDAARDASIRIRPGAYYLDLNSAS